MIYRTLSVFIFLLSVVQDALSQSHTVPGKAEAPYPTVQNIGIEWHIQGDDNLNSSVSVSFREKGKDTWRQGMPLRRVPPGQNVNFSWGNKHAGSLFDLQPDTGYEIKLSLHDPDGGSTERMLVTRTRPIPEITAGDDVVEIAPGRYDTLFTESGTASKYKVYRCSKGEAVFSFIDVQNKKWVFIDGLMVSNLKEQGKGIKMNGAENCVVRNCTINAVYGIVAYKPGAVNCYFSDNTITGTCTWTSESMGAHGKNIGEGIEITGPGNVICYNKVTGFRDCISTMEGQHAVNQTCIDIYNNDIYRGLDDAIEADFCFSNCRIMRNRITNCFVGLSSQPGLGGPVYFVRNVMYNLIHASYKLHRGSRGDVLMHNTVIKTGTGMGGNMPADHIFSRNNLAIGGIDEGKTWGGYDTGTPSGANMKDPGRHSDFDYDAVGVFGVDYVARIGDRSFSEVEKNGIERITLDEVFENVAFPYPPIPEREVPDLRPRAASRVVDAAVRIPNINDDYNGNAPDCGAYEAGQELPHYGPRPRNKRAVILDHLLTTFRSESDERPRDTPIWESWLKKSGELPPDFDELPSNALLPDLLKSRSGVPVSNPGQWPARKKEIREALDQYMLGHWPPPPPKTAVKYQNAPAEENELYARKNVQVLFAPSARAVELAEQSYTFNTYTQTSNYWNDYSNFIVATLNVELYLPKNGKPPYPAVIEPASGQETLRPQDLEKLERGYAVVRYFRKDADYIPAVYTEYECNQLEWWAYAAGRCVDFLNTRPDIDQSKIAVIGHSRNAKTALLAAAMDERIGAVIASHPGTGAGSFNLWRYAGDKFGAETLESSTRQFQYWNNPRMRFFIGRENKLPFDSHYLVSLVAPRPCLLGTGQYDKVGEVWGDQQCYLEVKKVYKLLGKEPNLGFYVSPGGHEETMDMARIYLDWLDMQFGRKPYQFENRLPYTYSFDTWKKITGENLDIQKFPEKTVNDIFRATDGKEIKTKKEWEAKAVKIKDRIKWMIGDLPAYDKITKVVVENEKPVSGGLVKGEIPIDEKLIAHLTYPEHRRGKLPVVIYLHAYLDAVGHDWSGGFGYSPSVSERLARNGWMAVEFNQFGYGKRNRDSGIEFYEKNRNVSALGVMIQDVRKIIDAVSLLDWVDKDRIMVTGYSLGGMVSLYAAVFDTRIKAVASTSGFASMRLDVHGNETEGIGRYAHLRPTIPRLGLFLGNEKRIPYDFHEVLALIAPRPVLILAPRLDQDWVYEDVEACYREAAGIFGLYGKSENIRLYSPDDFNRYPPDYQKVIINWLTKFQSAKHE